MYVIFFLQLNPIAKLECKWTSIETTLVSILNCAKFYRHVLCDNIAKFAFIIWIFSKLLRILLLQIYKLCFYFFRIDRNIDGQKDSTRDINEGESENKHEQTNSKKKQQSEEKKDYPHILKYIKTQVNNFMLPLKTFFKNVVDYFLIFYLFSKILLTLKF